MNFIIKVIFVLMIFSGILFAEPSKSLTFNSVNPNENIKRIFSKKDYSDSVYMKNMNRSSRGLLLESFETFPPEGWTIVGGENWVQGASNNAGGEAPEAMFNWTPATIGDHYLITPEISLEENTKATVCITFKQMIDHYVFGFNGYYLKLVYSSNLTDWTEIWSITPDASIPLEELNFTVQVNSPKVYFAWLFSGDSNYINYWCVDDVMIQVQQSPLPAPQNLVGNLHSYYTVELSWDAPNSGQIVNCLEEGFESGLFPPFNWTIADLDGDNWNWVQSSMWTGNSGNHCATSASYGTTDGALTPDNLLITPPIKVADEMGLSWYVAAQDASWAEEHYGVFVSSSPEPESFTEILFEETLQPGSTQFEVRNVDLTYYTGQIIYLAFRQFNCTDMFWLNLDDIVVGSPAQINAYNKKLDRNNIFSNVLKGGENSEVVDIKRNERILTPPQRDVLYYKIYREDNYLDMTTETEYWDEWYNNWFYRYGVSAVYEEGESEQAFCYLNPIIPMTFRPQWIEYGSLSNYSYVDAVGVEAFPWKAAIEFDFTNLYDANLCAIQTGLKNQENNLIWKVVDLVDEPTDNIIGNLTGTFNCQKEVPTTIAVNSYNYDLFGHKVAFVIESQGNFMALDIATPTNPSGNWAKVGSSEWIHLSDCGLEGNWFIRAYVNNCVGVEEILPGTTTLSQNYPNPFNPTTTISFFSNISGKVELNIFNSNGELVKNLMNENINAGTHSVNFDATEFNSGVYFYTLKTPTRTLTKKMVLVK
ncbi:MAG: choice-of-anchor J domain-containing protein [Candidatus Delongbacteria bacterium]|nr:choice-of-anchor J domain-containing protein [Candidatus Delongbacteria bacterium]MBN2833915.1 choice-of-anchor J domain-containing protein [Candidatus Delongbacteria bacterium]